MSTIAMNCICHCWIFFNLYNKVQNVAKIANENTIKINHFIYFEQDKTIDL